MINMENDPIQRMIYNLEAMQHYRGDLTDLRVSLMPTLDVVEAFMNDNGIDPKKSVIDAYLADTAFSENQVKRVSKEPGTLSDRQDKPNRVN